MRQKMIIFCSSNEVDINFMVNLERDTISMSISTKDENHKVTINVELTWEQLEKLLSQISSLIKLLNSGVR